MKSKKYIILLLIAVLGVSCSDDFLDLTPKDRIEDTPEFWNSETNVRNYAVGMYDIFFPGYNTGWSRSEFWSGLNVGEWVDDFAEESANFFTRNAPSSSSLWSFTTVRRVNLMIARLENSELPEETKNHWLGVGRFFRAMEYAKLVSNFGDVPWYDEVVDDSEKDLLYKPRDSRVFVMDKVLEDLNFANQNIRESDGEVEGLSVNKYVSLAFTSRIMLFEGTWQKYREESTENAKKYLQVARSSAQEVMSSDKYQLASSYKSLTNSLDLAGNPEIIIYRKYLLGVLGHSVMSYQIEQAQNKAPNKSLVDSYLSSNGLPINQPENTAFKGDKWFFDEIEDRDPRLYDNIDTVSLRLKGIEGLWAIGGYAGDRFVNESVRFSAEGLSSTNATDAPVMKLNEVLLNYLEASAELAELGAYTLSQNDLDISINILRKRESVNMPTVTLNGDYFAVNGINVDDPDRDVDVSPLLWEIRRERRIELVYEGFRFHDLRRWSKLEYSDMTLNPKINLGAWVDKPRFVQWYNSTVDSDSQITLETLETVLLDRDGDEGYILPIRSSQNMRTYSEKDYLYPIPTGQIKLYEDRGKTLTQNPGW